MTSVQDQLQRALGPGYRLERELGGGGMSHVYLAEEVALGRRVVIKVLPPDMAASVSVDRFRREIQLAAQLQHPGIVPLLTAGADGELLWYVMPYVEGESLRTRLARGPLPIDEAVRLWRDLLEALEYAHGRGIVHRDIKPENIMLTGRRAVTLDFGVAKAVTASTGVAGMTMTGVGLAIGTPAYMAPEQAAGDGNVDARADLYAAGLVLYEMLAGRGPFEARTPAEMMAAHIATPPVPIASRRAEVDFALSGLVMRCLAKRPEERPASAADVLCEVERLRTPSGERSAAVSGARRQRALVALAVVVTLAAIGTLAVRERPSGDGAMADNGTAALADSSRLQVAFLPVIAEPRDSILAQAVLKSQITALQAEPRLLVQTPTAVRALADDIGLPATTSDSLRALYREVGIHAYMQHTLLRSGDGLLLVVEGYATRADSALFRVEEPLNSVDQLSSATTSVVARVTRALRSAVGQVAPPLVTGRMLGTTPEAASLYIASRRAFDGREYVQSAQLLHEVLKADPRFAMAWSSLGASNRNGQLSEHEAAIASINAYRLRARIPSRVRRVFEEISYLRVTGQLDSALAVATRASTDYPGSWVIKLELGQVHSALRHTLLAVEAYRAPFEQVLSSRLGNVAVGNFVGALIQDHRSREAVEAMQRAESALGAEDRQVLGARALLAMERVDPDSLMAVGRVLLERATGGRDRQPGYTAISGALLLAGRLDSSVAIERTRRAQLAEEGSDRAFVLSLARDVYARAVLRGGDRSAASSFSDTLRARSWASLPVLDRGYEAVIPTRAVLGDLAGARRDLAEWERGVPREYLAAQRPLIEAAAGEIALAAGDGDAAIRAFRLADVGRCTGCAAGRIARAFDQLRMPDSAAFWYERVLSEPIPRVRDADMLDYPRAYRRLGELYEAKGDTKRAIQRYGDFVDLWKNADPALQPLVKDVRDRIARLQRKAG